MLHRQARHDYIDVSYAYGVALIGLILFIALSLPIDTSRLGSLLRNETKEMVLVHAADAFKGIDVKAKAYVVYDVVEGQVIASKQENERLPLASLTKVMTAHTALRHFGVSDSVTIRQGSIQNGYDLGLRNGQVWELGELIKYMLVFSSNDAAYAIADRFGGKEGFVSLMNAESALMELPFAFTDPAGLDKDGNMGGVGTALDTAKLFASARREHPEIMEATVRSRLTVTAGKEKVIGIPNTNQEIVRFFGAEASKTGFTDSAGGNLGVIMDISLGRPVVIIVLGSTREERFSDVEKLYEALLASLP